MKAARPEGSVKVEEMRRIKAARVLQRFLEAPWNAEHIQRHPAASIPDGSAEPCTLRADQIAIDPFKKDWMCLDCVVNWR